MKTDAIGDCGCARRRSRRECRARATTGGTTAASAALRGVIAKLDDRTVLAKSAKGDELILADRVMVVAVVKASVAESKQGMFIGSGAAPQPDGSQKALEVHIFAESMRGTGGGFRRGGASPP